ncbi:hypothetical protein NliqN6_6680 [Naganishia liquefaciens]|uniref:Uncharacterized protein n=1 Tax=Naganishia liquefaciens TaxID=104408 RepID=A0A8H3YID3_9TREE|nr:hypothetical protein NliqN6_6680 [Naganishia liquefaciens]
MKRILVSLLFCLATAHTTSALPTHRQRRSLMDFPRRADTPAAGCTQGGWQCVGNDLQRCVFGAWQKLATCPEATPCSQQGEMFGCFPTSATPLAENSSPTVTGPENTIAASGTPSATPPEDTATPGAPAVTLPENTSAEETGGELTLASTTTDVPPDHTTVPEVTNTPAESPSADEPDKTPKVPSGEDTTGPPDDSSEPEVAKIPTPPIPSAKETNAESPLVLEVPTHKTEVSPP